MLKYPRNNPTSSSSFFDDEHDLDEPMHPYQTPPQSPAGSVPHYLQKNIVRMFSTEDASGTSAVAIDNKIEQAMDLVKSHLMIAVREEVEVLKEKISELMDKITQLEVENTILKANISQETLQQLQLQITGQHQHQLQQKQQQQQQIAAAAAAAAAAAMQHVPAAQQQQQQQQQPQLPQTVAPTGGAPVPPNTTTILGQIPAADNIVVGAPGGNVINTTTATTTTNGPMS